MCRAEHAELGCTSQILGIQLPPAVSNGILDRQREIRPNQFLRGGLGALLPTAGLLERPLRRKRLAALAPQLAG